METSTESHHLGGLLVAATVVFALLSLAIVSWYLKARPQLAFGTKMALLFGVFVLPLLSAGSGNVAGFEATKTRTFCSGCHVMLPYTDDASDPGSRTLAALHGRNKLFGDQNCYACHADYGMFGTITTKRDGLIHAAHYYTSYLDVTAEEAFGRIHLYRPFRNDNCTQCHSMTLPGFLELEDHRGVMEEIRAGRASCASAGCHGPAHPFSKKESP